MNVTAGNVEAALSRIEANIAILEKTGNASMTSENTLMRFVDNVRDDLKMGVRPEGVVHMAQNVVKALAEITQIGQDREPDNCPDCQSRNIYPHDPVEGWECHDCGIEFKAQNGVSL